MIRGFYTAASGIVTQEKKLNVYANNLGNVNTAGFKKDSLISGTFGEHMAIRMDRYQGKIPADIGDGVYMQTTTAEYTDYTQGSLEDTGRPMDFALMGDGYFVIADEAGNEYLTRDGQFSLDADGYLILPGYGRVQGEGGDIVLEGSRFQVTPFGDIYVQNEDEDEPELLDRLMIGMPDPDAVMKKSDTGLFTVEGYGTIDTEEASLRVMQGTVERSNVNVAEEMTRIIASQRGLQSCSQILRMYDTLAEQSNSRISSIR